MSRPAALLVLLTVAPPVRAADEDLAAEAEAAFARGVELRHDAAAARPCFAQAAAAFDDLWHRGHRSPALALNRARTHRLAGDLPGSIVALHEGLVVARHDRPLQVGLAEAWAAVAYPLDGELAAECRPRPRVTIGSRMSPAEAYLAAGGLWLLACLAVARFVMSRATGWLGFGGLCLLALGLLGWLWWQDARSHDPRPVVVVAEDVELRKGNGHSYPPRFVQKLPKGVEARELGRRGGWVQVELAGGAAGWLPEPAVLTVRTD